MKGNSTELRLHLYSCHVFNFDRDMHQFLVHKRTLEVAALIELLQRYSK
jgi:hypothetical protein